MKHRQKEIDAIKADEARTPVIAQVRDARRKAEELLKTGLGR